MTILVAEDDRDIADLIALYLKKAGWTAHVVHSGTEALAWARQHQPDVVVLDVMMPGMSGLEVCRALRGEPSTAALPIIMVTARAEESDRISGLDLGADDYIAKPFSVEEVVARVRALVRRVTGETISLYKVRDLKMDLAKREVTRGSRRIVLTEREFRLLEHLMRAPGTVVTRTQIIEHVWEYRFDPGTNLVDVYIQRLRRKIDDGEDSRLIQTVRGVGYSVAAG